MKKRFLSLLLACWMGAMLLISPCLAADSFPDIPDPATAAAAETLRLMGVLDGYSDGTFRPEGTLTRAQFCKLVINAIGAEKELSRYAGVTVFPDVKPGHWAASYINLAAQGKKIIAGYADGSFHPDRTVTLGHAVTILLRLLGYKDEDIGGVWPHGHIAMADSIELTDGVGGSANTALSRGQAAKLFRNLLKAETAAGASFYTLSEETTLTSLDAANGKLVTPIGSYEMEKPQNSTTLVGSKGKVVLKNGKALTFLPTEDTIGTASSGAVLVSANGSTAGFSALTGNRSGYAIYKNGIRVASRELRVGDVAVWSAATNAVLVCDTRVTAYYENCSPGVSNPTSVEFLGTEFDVLPTARDTLARFHPGQVLTFYLSADGRVAGAVQESRGNAVAVLGGSDSDSKTVGTLRLLCGNTEIPLDCSASGMTEAVMSVSSDADGKIWFQRLYGGAGGTLDTDQRTLGGTPLAETVRLYDRDGLIALEDLDRTVIPAGDIAASRLNWAGQVDLILLGTNAASGTYYYGLASVTRDGDGRQSLTVDCGGAQTIGPFFNDYGDVRKDTYVAVRVNRAGTAYTAVRTMDRLGTVSASAWIGDNAVTFGGQTYVVPDSLPCYNRDTRRWMTLEQARDYADRLDLYAYGGEIRLIEAGA